ncbi:hypothetical protein HYH03_011059 [Edaphochlamys debaryana]|uniref:Uncharacterized protein n=1 Tax=Edaphochlamys debaryana TaxID=47281 RepID=A0A836BWR4_9CHLO|nr:hypothetical protein HYH03_011059 [Edaphochlamys debaryana]|eukprot:KAG2490423.1 hypothetical protein HYH03_011059 [Edaphochlamys debaryana]
MDEAALEGLLARPDLDVRVGYEQALEKACNRKRLAAVQRLIWALMNSSVPGDEVAEAVERVLPSALRSARPVTLEVVKCLLGVPGVNVNVGDGALLKAAAKCGHEKVVALLMDRPEFEVGYGGKAALHKACAYGRRFVVETLLDTGLAKSLRGDAAAQAAAEALPAAITATNPLYYETVDRLLAVPGVDPNADGGLALKTACERGKLEALDALLDFPLIDVNADRFVTFEWLGETNCKHARVGEVLQCLLARPDIDLNAHALTAICSRGRFKSLLSLVLKDPRFDAGAGGNPAALEVACGAVEGSNDLVAIVKELLGVPGHRFDVTAALVAACREGQGKAATILLDVGAADVHAPGVSEVLGELEARGANRGVVRLLKKARRA